MNETAPKPDPAALLPCPFCGSPPVRFTIEDDMEVANVGGDVIACTKCQCSTRVFFGEKVGIEEAWNTRAALRPPTPSPDDAAVLDELLATDPDLDRNKHHALYEAVLSRMSGVPEGWRDIASAPKNNTSRLVWCPLDRCIYCVAWVDNSEYPPAKSGWQVFGGGEIIDGVTHWMPLPAPPAAPEAGR